MSTFVCSRCSTKHIGTGYVLNSTAGCHTTIREVLCNECRKKTGAGWMPIEGLDPCPFDGNEGIEADTHSIDGTPGFVELRCSRCHIGGVWASLSDAKAAWNRRAASRCRRTGASAAGACTQRRRLSPWA